MYVDIKTSAYNANNNEVLIEAVDLDSILLNDWNQDFGEDAEVTFRFDLTSKGQRIYLYKLLRTQIKEDCKNLEEMVLSLPSHITNISSNFLYKG